MRQDRTTCPFHTDEPKGLWLFPHYTVQADLNLLLVRAGLEPMIFLLQCWDYTAWTDYLVWPIEGSSRISKTSSVDFHGPVLAAPLLSTEAGDAAASPITLQPDGHKWLSQARIISALFPKGQWSLSFTSWQEWCDVLAWVMAMNMPSACWHNKIKKSS